MYSRVTRATPAHSRQCSTKPYGALPCLTLTDLAVKKNSKGRLKDWRIKKKNNQSDEWKPVDTDQATSSVTGHYRLQLLTTPGVQDAFLFQPHFILRRGT